MAKRMHERQLLSMLNDPDVDEEELRGYFELDREKSEPFKPAIRPVDEVERDRDIVIEWTIELFNRASRRRRQRKYNRKIRKGFSGKRLVSEGDSWFQFPVLLRDVIDQLDEDYAIFSLGGAADLVEEMVTQNEIPSAVREIDPAAVLISGGGNDILGDGRLEQMVRGFDPLLTAADYPNETFEKALADIGDLYEGLFRSLHAEFPALPILCHSYDYAIPVAGGGYLGVPFEALGITDTDLQRQIIRLMIDRFSQTLQALDAAMPWVHFTDCRLTVDDDQWFDELHPKNEGFRTVGSLFMRKIEEVT